MAEYINREAVLAEMTSKPLPNDASHLYLAMRGIVSKAPTADVAEVKHGEWKAIVKQDNYFEPPYCDTCKCSVCGYVIDVSETDYNYCPNCGAKMKRSDDKNE